MIKIEYNLTSYEDSFRYIAKCLKLKITDNIISFPQHRGEGFIKFVNLSNGLQLIIYDYTPFEDILFRRKKLSKLTKVQLGAHPTLPENQSGPVMSLKKIVIQDLLL